MRNLSLLFIFLFFSLNTPAYSNFEFNIATLNTWMIPVLRKRANDRASIIAESLSKYDGAFLQEVFSKKQKRIFKNKLQGFNSYADVRPLGKLTSGLISFSKYPIILKRFIKYRACKLEQCFANKGVVFTRIQISEDISLDVYNTHTEPFAKRSWVRAKQMKQLMQFVLANDPLRMNPTIILGDLNIHSETREYDIIHAQFDEVGFRDSWVEQNGSDPGFTWNSFINEWGQRLERSSKDQTKERLDYIYIRDGVNSQVALNQVELILNERVQLLPTDKATHFLSDHFGVGASLTLY